VATANDYSRASKSLMKRPRLMIAILLCLSLAMAAGAQSSDSPESSEYLVKAGFIYNFAQLVQWPSGAFSQADSPIVIGIFGTDPFGPIIDRVIENKKLDGRNLVVKRFKRGGAIKDCNILFVSASETAHLDEVIQSTKGMPILTIGETPGFATRGGIINLTLEGNKVRFEVNIEAARQANLNISSRLLALAKIVNAQTTADERKSE
jgi:hypothetical protein